MKKNIKFLVLAVITSAVIGFSGCTMEALSLEGTLSTNVGENLSSYDPEKITYIDITYKQKMNTSFTSFYGYCSGDDPKGDTFSAVTSSFWIDEYTFRLYVNLLYNRTYVISINDSSDEEKSSWFRTEAGDYVDSQYFYFTTIPSPNASVRQDYEISIDTNNTINLEYNKYGPNQQYMYDLTDKLEHDYLRVGDTITLNYKLTSSDDITPIKMNIIDTSKAANDWTILSTDELSLVDSSFEVNNEYTGSVKFTVTTEMIGKLELQLFAPVNGSEYYSFKFKSIPSNKNYTCNLNTAKTIELSYNSYGPNQQYMYDLTDKLNNKHIKAGDTVTINFKLISSDDLSPVKINIIDTSAAANYWTILSDKTDETKLPGEEIAGVSLVDSSYEVNKEYTGSIKFNVATDMIGNLQLQFVAPLNGSSYYSFKFLE